MGTDNQHRTYIQPLIRTQKQIIRLLKNLPPRAHTNPTMTELQLLNITNIYILSVCTELHPFIYSSAPVNRPEHDHNYIFTSHIHEYPTRYSLNTHHYIPNMVTHKQSRKNKTHKYILEHLTKEYSRVWNTIPENIRIGRAHV